MKLFRETIVVLAAAAFAIGGLMMVGIQSVAGNSVNEAFYNAFGFVSFGFAGLTLVLGFTAFTRDQTRTNPTEFKRCVECNEVVWRTATKCPYCQTDLIEAEGGETSS